MDAKAGGDDGPVARIVDHLLGLADETELREPATSRLRNATLKSCVWRCSQSIQFKGSMCSAFDDAPWWREP